jgi:FAD/FMN-containing dehydrogenase
MTGVSRDDYTSWGYVLRASHEVSKPRSTELAAAEISSPSNTTLLGFGCGRSYGDVALNPEGQLIDCTALDRFVAFDRTTGVLSCEAGVRLADILAVICRPDSDGSGWMLPVTPGSRFVTVAGAIANDVHGKNHHLHGTFGRHVLSFELARSDGARVVCSPTENPELFAASIGGLGLTGLILRATIQLRRVSGLAVDAEDIRFDTLSDFFRLARESDADWEYTAAWVDCLATGTSLGRGIFSRARHAPGVAAEPPPRRPKLDFPIKPPLPLTNNLTVRAFNALYWRKLGIGTTHRRSVGPYEKVFYPLDAIGHWNRAYGPAGFYQFQNVVPLANAEASIRDMLQVITASGQGSMLSVLKIFGDQPSPGLMSFPMQGATLALDFPNRGKPTLDLLARLEAITVEAGGRLYPAKDGVMTAATLRRGYPAIDRFAQSIDPHFASAFARRVDLLPKFGI